MLKSDFTVTGMLLLISLGTCLGLQGAVRENFDTRSGGVTTWAAPATEQIFSDYRLRVNGHLVPVYACRVSAVPHNQFWLGYQRPLEQTELAGFAYWEMAGPVTVEVISRRPFSSVVVRPSSRGIQPVTKGRRIIFRLSRPGQVVVELDGPHHALHLFADPPETDAPKPGDPNVLYFGPGVHRPGEIQLKDNQTIYVAGGAVVYATIQGLGVSRARIRGRGIIDSSEFQRYIPCDPNMLGPTRGQTKGSIWLWDCSDVKVDGVILRDPPEWCFTTFGCRNLTISNIKLLGLWRYNSDGIDICNSEDVTIDHCFVRSFDDSIVVDGRGYQVPIPKSLKRSEETYNQLPVRHIRVSGLVIWCDWGRALEIGALTFTPEIVDVDFRDIDIIRNTHIAMDIQHSNRAAVHDIRYEDIRVEVDDVNPVPVVRVPDGKTYRWPTSPAGVYLPKLFEIVIRRHHVAAVELAVDHFN